MSIFTYQAGDILFVADKSLWSYLIRIGQGNFSYSHVCIIDSDGSVYSTGASKKLWFGRYPSFEQYVIGKDYAIGRYRGITPEQQALVMAWCKSQVGVNRYPLWKVITLAARGLMGKMVKDNGKTKEASKKLRTFCAESVALAYAAANIILNPKNRIKYEAYTPEAIWDDPFVDILFELDPLKKKT